ncbi:MAG: EthD domain-containing protein [Dehalococcoidia bacterium]
MIKLTYCLRRKPGLTWDEFSEYWRTTHAPLVKERAEVLGIKRYVQVRTLQDRSLHARLQARNGGSPEPFDGIAELWYESLGTGIRNEAASQAARELLDDERNFIDLANSPIWYGEETEVVSLV